MKEKNYLTINEPGIVQLHGFEDIKNYIYIEIFREKKHLLFLTKKRELKPDCFEVTVSDERTVADSRLYELIREFDLENKWFWPDEKFKHYLSTDIALD